MEVNIYLRYAVAIAQVLGLVSVPVTLYLLIRQQKRASAALRSISFNALVANSVRLISDLLRSPNLLADFPRRPGETEPGQRFHFMLLATVRHFENVHYQYQIDSVDDFMWTGYAAVLRDYMRIDRIGQWWSKNPQYFNQKFRATVDSLIP